MLIVPWDPVLKKNLLKKVLACPVNGAWDPHKNANFIVAVSANAIQAY